MCKMCGCMRIATLGLMLWQTVQAAGGAALPEGSQVTLGYNLARVREASGQLQEAAREYQSILDQFPGYLACQQRLAALAQKRGNYAEAERRLNEVLQAQPDDADTLAALGGANVCELSIPVCLHAYLSHATMYRPHVKPVLPVAARRSTAESSTHMHACGLPTRPAMILATGLTPSPTPCTVLAACEGQTCKPVCRSCVFGAAELCQGRRMPRQASQV